MSLRQSRASGKRSEGGTLDVLMQERCLGEGGHFGGISLLGVAEAVAGMRCPGKHHRWRQSTCSEVLKCSTEEGQVDESLQRDPGAGEVAP